MPRMQLIGHITSSEGFRKSLDRYSGQAVEVTIDSLGGDVAAGLSMHNALIDHSGHVTVRIPSLAASMASIVAMAGDRIIMEPDARMMIHSPKGTARGTSRELKRFSKFLEYVELVMTEIYVNRTGQERANVQDMLARETWLTAGEAVAAGFADEALDVAQAAAAAASDPQRVLEVLAKGGSGSEASGFIVNQKEFAEVERSRKAFAGSIFPKELYEKWNGTKTGRGGR